MVLFKLLKKVFKQKAQKKKSLVAKRLLKPQRNVSKKPRKATRASIKKMQKKPGKKTRTKSRKILKSKKQPLAPSSPRKKPKEEEVGSVTHYFGKISVGIIKVKAAFSVGDKIHIRGAHDDFTQKVSSMQYNHQDISSATKGLEVGIKVIQRVHENDKVYRLAT
jgi:putative protease